MKKLKLLVLFLISFYDAFNQTNADMGVAAIGLVVSDINASEKFYKELLGMKEAGEFSLDKQWSNQAGAANNEPFSVKMFKLQDQPTATILKLAYFKIEVPKASGLKGINSQTGVNYITLNYSEEDFQAAIARLEAAGVPKLGHVIRENYQLVFVRDPDGVFVEIVGPPLP